MNGGSSPGEDGKLQNGERRSSFNFLRRQRSTDKMNKKQRAALLEQQQRQQRQANPMPPQLPTHNPLPNIQSFGGDARPDSYAILSNQHGYRNGNNPQDYHAQTGMHAMPSPYHPMSPASTASHVGSTGVLSSSPGSKNGDSSFVDPYARTESMTHRGRYSYASSAISTATGINSPRRVRRRKDPTPFK